MHKLELMLELRFSFFFFAGIRVLSQFGDTCMDFVHITTQSFSICFRFCQIRKFTSVGAVKRGNVKWSLSNVYMTGNSHVLFL